MSVVTAAATFVFTVCLALGVRNGVRTRSSIRWIDEGVHAPIAEVEPALRFVILVPLLREQAVVGRLVERMRALDDAAVAGLRIAFITTAREDGDGERSTAAVLEDALRERPDPRFVHLHCDRGTDSSKADQLNFGLQQLGLDGARASDVFVGVYDGDSSPHPRTLTYIAARVREAPDLKAIQQVPLYLQNVRDARTPRGLYLMARPFHNALFALTVEVPCMRRQARAFASAPRSLRRTFGGWLSHGLGHGQFFRLDVLTDLGGFRPPSCDTQFGHALAFCGVPIHPHPMPDVGETPESVRTLVKQGVVWFNSMNTFWRTRGHVERVTQGRYHRPAAWAMMARLVHSNVAWAVYPLVFLAALAWAVGSGRWLLAGYGVAAWVVYLVPVALILARFDLWRWICRDFEPIAGVSAPTAAGILAFFAVEKLGSCISPFLWCAYAVRSRLRGHPIRLEKTERAAAA